MQKRSGVQELSLIDSQFTTNASQQHGWQKKTHDSKMFIKYFCEVLGFPGY